MRGIDNLTLGNGGSSTLAGLSDVSVVTPTTGQVIKYNSTTQKWENANESGGGTELVTYGTSTWQDVLSILQSGKTPVCAYNVSSSNTVRFAYITLVTRDNNDNPTQVKFLVELPYYPHTIDNQRDQTLYLTITNAGQWSSRWEYTAANVRAVDGLSESFSSNTVTLSASTLTTAELNEILAILD